MHDSQTLADIHAWLPELIALERARGGLRSPRAGRGGGDSEARVPFGIIIDDPTNPATATTADGIMAWATAWAEGVYADRAKPTIGPAEKPDADPLAYLTHLARWGAAHFLAWDDLIEEATTIRARVARRTGHAPMRVGWCTCGGGLWRQDTPRGFSDWMVCDGPAEHFFKDDAHYRAWYLAAMRGVTNEGHMLRGRQILMIWPVLDRRTLESWARRGKVARDSAGRYDLATVNTQAHLLARKQAA